MSLLPEINQASAEINKFVAQANIHQTIAPVNPAEFTSPADTLLLASRDPVIREVSVGMTGVEAVENTVSGTPPLSLPNSLGKPLKAWSVDVLPYQEGTGDPSPSNVRPIYGTDKLTITTAGKNLIQNTATSRTINNVEFTVNTDGSVKVYGTANGTAWLRGVTSQSEQTFIKAGTYTLTGGVSSTKTLYIVGDMVDGTAVNNTSVGNVYDHGNGVTITLPKDAYITYQIQINNGTQADDTFYPMFRIASDTDTTFTPYIAPSQTVITLPQTVYTGTIGSEGGESRWGEVDLGTLTWIYNNTEYSYGYFQAMISDKKQAEDNNFLCESYANATGNRASLQNNQIARRNNTSSNICIRNDTYTDVESFVQSLQGIKLIYELATPTTFAVPSVTIPTPTGTATTWATAEDGAVDGMEVTYYKSE